MSSLDVAIQIEPVNTAGAFTSHTTSGGPRVNTGGAFTSHDTGGGPRVNTSRSRSPHQEATVRRLSARLSRNGLEEAAATSGSARPVTAAETADEIAKGVRLTLADRIAGLSPNPTTNGSDAGLNSKFRSDAAGSENSGGAGFNGGVGAGSAEFISG